MKIKNNTQNEANPSTLTKIMRDHNKDGDLRGLNFKKIMKKAWGSPVIVILITIYIIYASISAGLNLIQTSIVIIIVLIGGGFHIAATTNLVSKLYVKIFDRD